MLMGEFNHTIDAKNRIFIPAKHRDKLGDTFIITKNVDKCLSVFSMEEWSKYTEKLDALPNIRSRDVARFFYSNATDVSPDSHGRVVLPQPLIQYAGLEKNAVIVGVGNHAEIWAEDVWQQKLASEDTASLIDTMIDLGL